MNKKLLRFCVLIYKGIIYISNLFFKFIGTILKLITGEENRLLTRTERIIANEKKKQNSIIKREDAKFIRASRRQDKILEKKRRLKEKEEARLGKIALKKQKKLERRATLQRKENNTKKRNKIFAINHVKNDKKNKRKELREQARLAKIQTRAQADISRNKRKEELFKRSLLKKQKTEEERNYNNNTTTIKKLTFAEQLKDLANKINAIPDNIKKYFREKLANTSIGRSRRDKLDLNKKALLEEFEAKKGERSNVKIMYEYVVKDNNGKIIKGHADGFSKIEVHSYLLSEGYEVYSITTNKLIQLMYGTSSEGRTKIKTKDLVFFATQLSTYLKSGITLIESLKILSRQYKNKKYITIFKKIIYDLSMGENFSTALENRGVAFPNLLITMVKAAEMTGELPEVLDDMADYYTEVEKTRKQMITAMMYPTIVFVFAIMVLTFILLYVIPKFVGIYASMDGVKIPGLTQFIIDASNFFQKNLILIGVITLIIIILFRIAYKQVKAFRTGVQWILMHLPVVKNIIIYKEVTMFTKTFSSLLAHNVYITDSMDILRKVTQNEIYRTLILNTVTNLARGERLSAEFEGHWAFPIPAYEMIVTGERTGQLPEMMGKVSAYYQELHQNSVSRIKTFIEPFLIVFLTGMVGVIVLSIVLPMFNMYQSIQQV